MRVPTIIAATATGLSLLPTSSAIRPVHLPRGEESPCDATCMRRFLYDTGYASAAAGVGLVMDAYNSSEWCVSDTNTDWCPALVNVTVSNIAGKAMSLTNTSSDPSFTCGPECMVKQIAEVTRVTAIHAMSWAAKTVNGTTMSENVMSSVASEDKPDAAKKIDWMIGYLMHNSTSTVNAEALHKAMDAYKGPKPVARRSAGTAVSGEKKKKKKNILGLGTTAAFFGTLMAGGTGYKVVSDCLRPEDLVKLATSPNVLENTAILKWLAEGPNLTPETTAEIMAHGAYQEAYPELYPEYASRVGGIPESEMISGSIYWLDTPDTSDIVLPSDTAPSGSGSGVGALGALGDTLSGSGVGALGALGDTLTGLGALGALGDTLSGSGLGALGALGDILPPFGSGSGDSHAGQDPAGMAPPAQGNPEMSTAHTVQQPTATLKPANTVEHDPVATPRPHHATAPTRQPTTLQTTVKPATSAVVKPLVFVTDKLPATTNVAHLPPAPPPPPPPAPPPPPPPAPPACQVDYMGYVGSYDDFRILGVGWDESKLSAGGAPGSGLHHQLKKCSGLSLWTFLPQTPTGPESPWTFRASGRTTISQKKCIQRAIKSAGAPSGRCSGSG
ncbi:hypothetical protein LTR36_007585 [Oleoguttula mirabilis]|uniref:Uncharacterized protein n=1 Tax=Oleoguttula mirabilis TaxID=1507867 RepID=A0AAV9JUB3_9PEZI|nr:hypothetical protein LTR36_007585 [Oleoguttula mirabilis]